MNPKLGNVIMPLFSSSTLRCERYAHVPLRGERYAPAPLRGGRYAPVGG